MFSPANTKLKKLYEFKPLAPYLNKRKVYSFDLLSGWCCPYAKDCKSKVVETDEGLRVQDGPHTQFRCYSASQEAIYRNAYNKRKANWDAIRGLATGKIVKLIESVMPKNLGVCRIHAAGDFINQRYFFAWCKIAERHPDILFYAYTKCLPYWVAYGVDSVPLNMVLTASCGGRADSMIDEHDLRSVKVVYSESEAKRLGLELDNDDSHASDPNKQYEDFALLIHGIQPKDSEAAEALKVINAAKKRKA